MLLLSTAAVNFINSSSSMELNWHFFRAPSFVHHTQPFSDNQYSNQCVSLVDQNCTNISAHSCTTFESVIWKRIHNHAPTTGIPGQHHPCSGDIQLHIQDRQPVVYSDLSSWTPPIFWSSSNFWWTAVSWSLSILWIQYGSAYCISTYKLLSLQILIMSTVHHLLGGTILFFLQVPPPIRFISSNMITNSSGQAYLLSINSFRSPKLSFAIFESKT